MFLSVAALLETAVVTTRVSGPPQGGSNVGPSAAPGQAALIATINSEAGQIEASAAQPKLILDTRTRQALRTDTEGLRQTYHPNGAVSVNLQGRFQSVSVARIDEGGKLVVCTEVADHAEKAAQGSPIVGPVSGQTPEVK
jgi:hypothetical protein